MKLEVKQIKDEKPEWIDIITEWMYQWWGKREGYRYDAVRCYVKYGLQEERLPQTFGLFLEDKLIGIYQFRLDDLFVRPDLYPWLANVYLDFPYRNKGYGGVLMESVRDHAKNLLSYREIYLYTTHIGLYEKYGWEFISEIDTYLCENRIQRLYKLKLI